MDIIKNKLEVYIDILLLLTLLIFSAIVSSYYLEDFIKNGNKPDFYQNLFSPAVLDTCGRGFKVPILKEGSALKEFLDLKKDHFSCENLEANLPIRVGLSTFTGQTQYFMKLVAWTWSIRGISWSVLTPIFVVFFSVTMGILYGLFRLGMGRGIAFAISALLSISWVHLSSLPHLRDYSKATFILALILILGCLVKWGNRRVYIISMSAFFGTVLGIGLGFRQDVIICIPPLLATLFFLLPCGLKSNIRAKLEGLFLAFLMMLLTGWGPLSSFGQGQNGWHASLLGLAPSFNEALGLKESIYQWIAKYDDKTVQAMASIYSYNKDSVYAFVSTSPYDEITARYFFEFVKLFPADFLIRVFGSFFKIINLSFVAPGIQTIVPQSMLGSLFLGRHSLMAPFMSWGLCIVTMTLIVLSAYKIRLAIFSTLFLLYFSAVQTLQFHIRHHFYLEFISLWCFGFLLYHSWIRAREPIEKFFLVLMKKVSWSDIVGTREQLLKRLLTPLKFAGVVLLLGIGTIYCLREYQEQRLKEVFSAYEKAELVPLKWQVVHTNNSNFIELKDFTDTSSLWPIQKNIAYGFQYLVAEFQPRCESSQLTGEIFVKFIFGRKNGPGDLAKTYRVIVPAKATEPTRVFYPVHSWNDTRDLFTLKRLELTPLDMPCLKKIYKAKKPLSLSPLTIILTLPQDWENQNLHLSLK